MLKVMNDICRILVKCERDPCSVTEGHETDSRVVLRYVHFVHYPVHEIEETSKVISANTTTGVNQKHDVRLSVAAW